MRSLLASRSRVPEIMDRLDLDPERHVAALRGLARLNAWSGSAGILWPPIERLFRERAHAGGATATVPFRILDIASGAGDVPIRIALRANRLGFPVEVTGCDRSPIALEHARREASLRSVSVRFLECDVVQEDLAGDYDVVMCSLFLHHLEDSCAVRVLQAMRQAARSLVLVCDLDRRPAGLVLTWAATRLLTLSDVVRFDGPASVRAAFTPEEAAAIAGRAGLIGAVIERRWPFRWLLEWRVPAP